MRYKTLFLAIAMGLGSAATAPGVLAKGKPGTEVAAQNLSVPTIMVGGLGMLSCGESAMSPSQLVRPTGIPRNSYEVPGEYWVQKLHLWQAQCFNAESALVFGNWGDNMEGSASLKVGSPIRVELVLTNMTDYAGTMRGYDVIKLEPSKLDRLSAYGHLAPSNGAGGWGDIPQVFGPAQWLVHDAGITFSVQNMDTGAYAVEPGTNPTAEINATGKVVYGYNLRVERAGNYRIQFTSTPNVQFTGQDAANGGLIGINNVYIDIVVDAGGGKGGRR